MENCSDPSPTKRTRLSSAGEAATPGAQVAPAGDQDTARGCRDAAPGADTASSAVRPLMPPSLSNDGAPHNVRVHVEAFGSGAILHAGLDIPSNKSVGDLRHLVLSSIRPLPPRTRSIRLFVGHGGTELDNDETSLSGSLAAVDLDATPLVAFPVSCMSALYPLCRNNAAGGDAPTHFQRWLFVFAWLMAGHDRDVADVLVRHGWFVENRIANDDCVTKLNGDSMELTGLYQHQRASCHVLDEGWTDALATFPMNHSYGRPLVSQVASQQNLDN